MVTVRYSDSAYRFTDPIRFHKPYDPYIADVDNLPLKQIHTNVLWLKDQIDRSVRIQELTREDFDELRPYVTETDNKIRVKPGRFSARINDAYRKSRFIGLVKVASSFTFGNIPIWLAATYTAANADLVTQIDKVNSLDSEDATFLNGLVERAFTYPMVSPIAPYYNYLLSSYRNTGIQLYSPIEDGFIWRNPLNNIVENDIVSYVNGTLGMTTMAFLESAFVKFWNGITRIAVVDVPEEISLEIPNFRDADFDYTDSNGNKVSVTDGTHRIDLVFIYSKPIDASSTTILKKSNGVNEVLTTPALGIIRGAGLIVDLSDDPKRPWEVKATNRYQNLGVDADGNIQIKASVADQQNTTGGFSLSGIYGSFPTEDLANLAPLLAEELEANDPALVGQSILPVAYVVVRKAASLTEGGNVILTSADVIDVRPFFRTTELTYNERAGIAAAKPQISLANPVVTRAELYVESNKAKSYIDTSIRNISTTQNNNYPRTVGMGYIFGGLNYGVEGAIADYIKTNVNPNATNAEVIALIKSQFGYRSTITIPEYPDWDGARWAVDLNPGAYANDFIHTMIVNTDAVRYSSFKDSNLSDRLTSFGIENANGKKWVCIHFVKKTVNIDKSLVTWMDDYIVNVNLLNCTPLSCRSSGRQNEQAAGTASVWVEKKASQFIIYCAWVANDFSQNNDEQNTLARDSNGLVLPYANRDNGDAFAGWAVLTNQFIANSSTTYKVDGGSAIYPSVTFEVVGIPRSYTSVYSAGGGTLRLS